MSQDGKTPGRAAYEALQRAFPYEDWGPWDSLDEDGRAGWEAIATAAVRAQSEHLRLTVTEMITEGSAEELAGLRGEVCALTIERLQLRNRLAELRAALDECPAAAERDTLRTLVTEILGTLNTASCEGLRPARIHPQQLSEWQQRAGQKPAEVTP